MADNTSDEFARAIQLANTLKIEDVPAKLRCGMCNKLAVDAVKLFCCSTSICEPCSHDIPETCSICTHSPTLPDSSTPDKKLRSTVRAFIRTEEKKRGRPVDAVAAIPVEAPTPAPAASETPTATGQSDAGAFNPGDDSIIEGDSANHMEPVEATAGAQDAGAEDEVDIDSTAVPGDADPQQEEEEEDDDDGVVITTERPELEAEQSAEDQQYAQGYEEEYSDQSYGGQTNGQQQGSFGQGQHGYGNMNGFNPMMGMQNGMGIGNFGMGMPNMMGMGGMAGMNLDPSMIFSNGGFGGMGDMMNMGMGGMNGMNGMGGFGGMPGGMGMNMNMNMGSGSGGFFGPGNSGGYNHQQQYGNQLNTPFHNQRGYYNQGRGGYGRGRGAFYGRGGRGGGFNQYNKFSGGQQHNYMNQQHGQGYQSGNNFQEQADHRRGSPVYDTPRNVAQQGREGEEEDTNGAVAGATDMTDDRLENDNGENTQPQSNAADGIEGTNDLAVAVDASTNDAGSVHNDQSFHQQDLAYRHARGGYGAQGGAYGNVTTIGGESKEPPAPPMNAPKGPKAMRQGLPNNGRYSRPQQPSVPPTTAVQHAEDTQDRDDQTPRDGRQRTRSRSLSRHDVPRDRERSPLDERESDEAYAERRERERERRKRKERESRDLREKHEEDPNGKKSKSRSDSLDDHERRKHRDRHDERHSSRRDRSRSRERRKHRDRSRSPEKSHRVDEYSSDRSRRKGKSGRSREDEDEHDRGKDRHGSRKHSRRDDDYEYDSKNRSKHSRSSKADGGAREPVEDLGISIKGAAQNKKASLDMSMGPPSAPRLPGDDRYGSAHGGDSTPATPVTPAEDRYAADREEQIRKRLVKHSNSLGKRTSRTEDDPPEACEERRGSRSKRQRQDTRKHSARFE